MKILRYLFMVIFVITATGGYGSQSLSDMQVRLNNDIKDLAGAVDLCTPFIRSVDALKLSGTEEQILLTIASFKKKLDVFSKDDRINAESTLKSFGEQYGTDFNSINDSVKRIMGNKPIESPRLPQTLFDTLKTYLKKTEEIRKELSDKLLRIAKRNSETNATDPAVREKSFDLAKRSLELAGELDPENEDVKTLYKRLGGSIKAAAKKADAYLDAGTWGPHFSGFQGPGNADKLAKSALKWFKNDAGWVKDKDPISVRINGDWRVAEKNLIGEPLSWGLPIEAAFIRHKDRDSKLDAAWVYSLTIVTRDAKKSPPWKTTWVGSNRQMRASNVKNPSDGSGPNIIFRLLLTFALLCSGGLLAAPKLKIPPSLYDKVEPFRPMAGVGAMAVGAVLLLFNTLSPLSDILPQAACVVSGLFLGFEILMKKPFKLATEGGDDFASKAGRNVDEAVRKTQDFLAKQEQRIRGLERYQVPMGIVCLVLALLHLVAGGVIFI